MDIFIYIINMAGMFLVRQSLEHAEQNKLYQHSRGRTEVNHFPLNSQLLISLSKEILFIFLFTDNFTFVRIFSLNSD